MEERQYSHEHDDDVVLFTYPGEWPKADEVPDITDDDSYTVYMCVSRSDNNELVAEYFNSVYHPQFRSACRALWSDLLLRCPMELGQRIEMDTEPTVRFSKRGDGFVIGLFTKQGYAKKKGWPESFQRRIGFRMVNEMFEIIDENHARIGTPGSEAEMHRSLEEIAIRFDYHSAPTWGYETSGERQRQEREAKEDATMLREAAEAKRLKKIDLTRRERQGKLASNLMSGLRSTVRNLDPTTLLAHLSVSDEDRKPGAKERFVRDAFGALDITGQGVLRGAEFGSLVSLLLLHQNGWQQTAPTDISERVVSTMLGAIDPSASGQLKAEELIERLQSWSLEECAQLAEAASVYALESQAPPEEGLASKRAAAEKGAAAAAAAAGRGSGGFGGGLDAQSVEQVTRVVHQMGLAAGRLTRLEDKLDGDREGWATRIGEIVDRRLGTVVVAMAEQHYSILAATMFAYSDSAMTRFALYHGVDLVLRPLRQQPQSLFMQTSGMRLIVSMLRAAKGRPEQAEVELALVDKHAAGIVYVARQLHRDDAELMSAASDALRELSVDEHAYAEAANFIVRAAALPITDIGQRGATRILLEQRNATTRGDAIHEATARALHFVVSASPILARLVSTLDSTALVEERVMYRGRVSVATRANFNNPVRALEAGPQNAPMGRNFARGGSGGGGSYSGGASYRSAASSPAQRWRSSDVAFALQPSASAGFSAATKAAIVPDDDLSSRSIPAVRAMSTFASHAVLEGTRANSEYGMMRTIATKTLAGRAEAAAEAPRRVPRFNTSPTARQAAPPAPISWRGKTREVPRVMDL